jgi:hypothetical protein
MPQRALLRAVAAALALALVAVAPLAGCTASRAARRQATAAEAPWSRRAFAVRGPGHGRILLSIPPGWSVTELARGGEASFDAVVLDGPAGAFRAVLTPLWNPGEPESAEARIDTAQLFAEIGRRKALSGSVERELALEQVEGPGVRGFYFAATDRELVGREVGPGEWRNILQGAAAVGPVILAFTLLDDGPGPQRTQLLDVVRTARHLADGEEDRDEVGEVEALPDEPTLPLRVAWPGKTWAVLVDLPEFRVGIRRGAPALPPAVLAVDPGSGIVATVSLREAPRARDAAACRAEALAAITRGIPRVSAVQLGEGSPARASYVVTSEQGVAALHAHAFLSRDGLCANVHVSKAEPSAEDPARVEAILSSVRFGEDL